VTFVRTVLGDIPADSIGPTYAHEHLIIDGGRPVELFPDFLLADVDRMATELDEAKAAGLRTAVDAMPADAGRNASALAELSRRTGVNVVAPTGLHHVRYYVPSHWSTRVSEDDLTDLFVADIETGIDTFDYSGPLVRRTPHRAGVIKIAGSDGGPSPRDARIFRAAAAAHLRTGAPILTHCEGGTGALEQIRVLVDAGVDLRHVAVSHVDKVVDAGYHREILATGASAEYDQSFRWGDAQNGTLRLLIAMKDAGFGDRLVLGMDAARQGCYHAYGGQPGLGYLLREFSAMMAAGGLGEVERHALFVDNPARVFAFGEGAGR
jgi:predicted metal-dependent phosphotriesterase family hydrolase